MSRPVSSLHRVGQAGSSRAATVLAAGQVAGLAAGSRDSVDLRTAIAAPAGVEVLVLLDPAAENVTQALEMRDERGLPCWAVVPSSWEEAQSPEFTAAEWDVRIVARAIKAAIALLELRRENARLRGDLGTIGRRLTHDLRMPLNLIGTANQALAELTTAADGAADLHRSMANAVQDAAGLIERVGLVLLASARALDPRPVDMEEVVWKAREKLETRFRSAGATIHTTETWPVVNGVASLLELVWVNLLANSVQHGGPAARIELGWNRCAAHTCFWIRDSGQGIPVAKRSRLFHPLDRLNELNAPRGYGLPIVQRLIELHGGSVGYDPDPSPGGTFSFTLPGPE
jgi:light-regulated signal transduction histidine kinase (bacteriophytochrome)